MLTRAEAQIALDLATAAKTKADMVKRTASAAMTQAYEDSWAASEAWSDANFEYQVACQQEKNLEYEHHGPQPDHH